MINLLGNITDVSAKTGTLVQAMSLSTHVMHFFLREILYPEEVYATRMVFIPTGIA